MQQIITREGQEFENIDGPLVIQEYIQQVIRRASCSPRPQPLGCGEYPEETPRLRDKCLDLRARPSIHNRPKRANSLHEAALHAENLPNNDSAPRILPLHNARRPKRRRDTQTNGSAARTSTCSTTSTTRRRQCRTKSCFRRGFRYPTRVCGCCRRCSNGCVASSRTAPCTTERPLWSSRTKALSAPGFTPF